MRRKPPEECVSAGSCHLFPGGCRNRRGARGGRAGWNGRLYNKTITALPRKVARLAAWRRRPGRGGGDKDPRGKKKRPQSGAFWRRGRDSNPRKAKHLYTLSRRATSTTHPPLRWRSTDYSRIGAQKARGGPIGRSDFPVRARTAQNGREPKAGRGARRSEIAVGRPASWPPRRVGPPSLPPRARPCSRHALATLSPRARHALAARSPRSCCFALVLSFPLPNPPSSPSLGQGCGAPYDLPPDYRKITTCAARRPARARLRAGSRAGAPVSIGGCSRIGWGVLSRLAAKPRRAANGSRGAGFRGRSA